MLGDVRFDLVTLPTTLWPHDEERLTQGRQRHPARPTTALNGLRADALDIFKRLRSHSSPCHLEIRECLHGDLNVTNIAVDGGAEAKGYIFDASGIRRGLTMWDLATLEITALLHLPPNTTESIVLLCGEALYGADFIPPEITTLDSQRAMNILALIRALRCYANQMNRRASYALCVFDVALVQVGGLAWPSGNKVCSFADAVLLADLAAGWLSRIAPNLFEGSGGQIDIDS